MCMPGKTLCCYVVVPFSVMERKIPGEHLESPIPPAVVECMKHSDMVVDMVVDMMTVDWLYTDVHTELVKANARTLMVKEPEEILVHPFPAETIKARGLEGQKLLANASDFRVTSDWGTNLVFKKDGRCANYQWGVSDSPGR